MLILLACVQHSLLVASISAARQKGKLPTEQENNWVQTQKEGELILRDLYIQKRQMLYFQIRGLMLSGMKPKQNWFTGKALLDQSSIETRGNEI